MTTPTSPDPTTSADARDDLVPGPDAPDTHAAAVDDLEFGPSGYLPPKASARARKIVLRAPLGIQWVIGAVVAGIVVVVAGVLWLSQSGPPEAPFVATVAVSEIGDSLVLDDLDALAVTAGGPVVVFAAATDLELCPVNGRIEGGDGVWSASTGRGLGTASLTRHPTVVHDGILYVDPTTTTPGPTASSTAEAPACS